MKVIKPSYEILDRSTLHSLQKIEQAGRVAYKSEDKITEDSCVQFVEKMLSNKHMPVIEFSNVHVYVECTMDSTAFDGEITELIQDGNLFKYHTLSTHSVDDLHHLVLLSGTVRAFMEILQGVDKTFYGKIMPSIINALNTPNPFFPLTIENAGGTVLTYAEDANIKAYVVSTEVVRNKLANAPSRLEKHLMCAVKFICNRAVTHELVRHRPVTIIQESQRYCRYSADKFGNEVTFIAPSAFFDCPGDFPDHPSFDSKYDDYHAWYRSCDVAEQTYFHLLSKGNSPQAARTVLPNSCKTEIILYATIEEWRHIFDMRTSPAAEPSMRELTVPLSHEFFTEENKLKWE